MGKRQAGGVMERRAGIGIEGAYVAIDQPLAEAAATAMAQQDSLAHRCTSGGGWAECGDGR